MIKNCEKCFKLNTCIKAVHSERFVTMGFEKEKRKADKAPLLWQSSGPGSLCGGLTICFLIRLDLISLKLGAFERAPGH